MPDAFTFGHFIVPAESLILGFSGLFSYLVVRYRLKKSGYNQDLILDAIITAVIIFLIVWKFSLILFKPLQVVDHPLMIVYFSGGQRGFWLAFLIVALYLYRKAVTGGLPAFVFVDTLTTGGLAAVCCYYFILLIASGQFLFYHLYQAVVALLLFVYLFARNRIIGQWAFLNQILLWASLTQIFILYFVEPRGDFLFGFSPKQTLLFVISVLAIALDWWGQSRLKHNIN